MGDRNDIQLAIGYGLGAGMVVAGLFVIVGHVALSFFEVGGRVSVYVLGAVVVLGGVAIAVVNALRLDRSAISDVEEPPE